MVLLFEPLYINRIHGALNIAPTAKGSHSNQRCQSTPEPPYMTTITILKSQCLFSLVPICNMQVIICI